MIPLWFFTGLAALLLATVAGGFSIIGLGALYQGAFLSVIGMGAVIEIGKLAATFWLHKNYYKHKIASIIIGFMILLAMGITSGGVYGYLSKGHLEQEAPIANKTLQIETLNTRIVASQQRIKRAETTLSQMNSALQVQIDEGFASRAQKQRIKETPQRNSLNIIITNGYQEIEQYNDKLLVLKQDVANVEAKLGPVKYLAELLELPDNKTVQYFTMLIVILLDPFAIMLVLATGMAYDSKKKIKHNSNKEIIEKIVEVPVEKIVEVEKLVEVPVEKIVEKIVEVEKIVTDTVKQNEPLTMESLTSFLENEDMQNELVNNPELIKEVESILAEINKKQPNGGWLNATNNDLNFKKGR